MASARGRLGAAWGRLGAARSWLGELSGGLGDAGLFIPIAVAMITLNGLNATAVFLVTGLVYIATALYFRVPIPVQPLKAFGAAAIALGLEAETIAAGALLMAVAMALLTIWDLADRLAARFPIVLVRGIQASVALLLAKAAVDLASQGNWPGLPQMSATAGLALAAFTCLLLFASRAVALPGSLAVLAIGAGIGLAVGGMPDIQTGPQAVSLSIPDIDTFGIALTSLVLAQLPLTFGNSIVATTDAERAYFGARARRVKPARLAASIGISNAVAGVSGAMPVCHGAGGVTAHYKLGARTPLATISAGALFVGLALGVGASLPTLLQVLVPGALAGMLAYVAIQHGVLAGSLKRLDERLIAVSIGLTTLATGNLAIGFGLGVALVGGRALRRRRRLENATSNATRGRLY
ncbi:MAG TPA: putative sulfate/molybdate transporter [Solirubrobacterales bacterium]|nr:putative sulfate/molybdate transporter [Solirubrobacterales bacterium]